MTPQQAEQVSPEAVQTIARQASRTDLSIMDKAAGFYAQHPTLVKTIGARAGASHVEDLPGEEVNDGSRLVADRGSDRGMADGQDHGGGGGVLMDIILGLVGALAGGFLMSLLGFKAEGGMIYTILVALLGASSSRIYRKVMANKAA